MPSSRKVLLAKTLDVLEWPRLTERLAERAASALGADACRNTPLASGVEAVRRCLAETSELATALRNGASAPFMAFDDARPVVAMCAKGGVPEAGEFAGVAAMIEASRLIRGFFKTMRDSCPLLWERASALIDLGDLKKSIDDAIDSGGSIRENATPELRRLLRSARDKRAHLIGRIEEFIHENESSATLMDGFYTQRAGRYVVPVKSEFRSKVEGIVHDSSNSGQTLFIEPRAFIAMNNELKMSEMEVEAEVRRILATLAAQTAKASDALVANVTILIELDLVYARSRLSIDLDAAEPSINPKGRIELFAARHPLLALAGEVVPNDVAFGENTNVLVISGPNTGGKTVTLKMLGLFALMIRAGIHIPASGNSTFGLFREVYADIGDEQDIERHLSTFSGHMMNIIGIINSVSQGSLVLLDELVTSTDPGEGSALAAGVLRALADKGAKVVATTHYSQLKAYAESQAGFRNASVEFDSKSLSPTYRLAMGVPGRSSALEIAQRLGMDEKILADARELLSESDKRIEDMLGSLEKLRGNLNEEIAEAERLKATARRHAEENEKIGAELKQRNRELRASVRQKMSAEIRAAREKIDAVMDSLNKDRSRIVATTGRMKLRDLENELSAEAIPRGVPAKPEELREGDAVVLSHLGASGVMLEDAVDKGKIKRKVKVKVGRATMTVSTDSISLPDGESESFFPSDVLPRKKTAEAPVTNVAETPAMRLDLRGYRVEDALDETMKFLDRASLLELHEVEIIHGHGTGALKKTVRELLSKSELVAEWKPADLKNGGDGVSVVTLK